ncbi:hypothetical protein IW261DRAFT_1422918 [Armillaria novae-zelandiae]|uniref:Uncharacterized protein n=1 Tax=Armillaria novae-zelandiae TaxID=153914 RepID=A0AA39NZ93_9AGAR|nr:hypothetical protein IW261DRAFT_1422918 [Armillaria novae-zelandiae]
MLARLLQPKIQDLIDLVHPFLPSWQIAHEQFYPHNEDPVSLCFLAMVTSLVNNLSPAFQSKHWFAWKMTDPCFEPSDLFPGKVSAPSLGVLSARRPWLHLTPTGAFKQGLDWFHFHMLSLAEDMTQESLPTVIVYFDECTIAYWSQPELASPIGLIHPFLELSGLFGTDDQFPGDEGKFMAVGLNVIQFGSETLPSHINTAFELAPYFPADSCIRLAPIQSATFPALVPEESIFHLNSYE